MALPKAEGRDPASEAMMEYDRRMQKQAQQELHDMAEQAREIERTQGEAARVKFEKQFKQNQKKRAEEKIAAVQELKRNLLEQGIDPLVDLEGQRQVNFLESGVDLGDVPGTPFHMEKEFERKNYKRSLAYKLAPNRQIIALIVKDLKNRGVDPVQYFQQRQDKTQSILELPAAKAQALVEQYSANLERYGQVTVPKEGEVSVLEKMTQAANTPEAKQAAKQKEKDETKRLRAEAKARAKAEKEQAKLKAKQAAEEAKAAAAGAAARATFESPDTWDTDSDFDVEGETESPGVATMLTSSDSILKKSSGGTLHLVPATAFLVAVGGGTYAFRLYQEKATRDEEERQRQFRLLMGLDNDSQGANGSSSPKKSKTATLPDVLGPEEVTPKLRANKPEPKKEPKKESVPVKAEEALPSAPKKKRLGLKNVFSRKKNDRETDLAVVVGPESPAPEFAKLLSKILTFGAPGRFPVVKSLPGEMPMVEFDLETAKQMLTEAREEAGLKVEESAEIFADVVNCMLIDIVDLASSSLKEDDKVTIDAINIVVDFMKHAASLYDSVAAGVIISPVTYGGDLAKLKLEQMYSTYSGAAMLNMENVKDDFDDRLRLLQDVFQISDKKAEGLMMKVMQKNMMEMLKSGEGLEGMQGLLQGMGGMEGMPDLAAMAGMGAEGEEPSPEQVKEMLLALKGMKDSGSFSKEELATIKQDFKNSFGSSIEEIANSNPLDPTEKELLELMKSILDD